MSKRRRVDLKDLHQTMAPQPKEATREFLSNSVGYFLGRRKWQNRNEGESGAGEIFLPGFGWGGMGVVGGLSIIGFIRSAFPRVHFQPPSTFKAGLPSDYAVGEVSEKYKQEYRVWIVREEEGMYAVFAKCTHLGCTPRWLATEQKFKCPCHGSGFYKTA